MRLSKGNFQLGKRAEGQLLMDGRSNLGSTAGQGGTSQMALVVKNKTKQQNSLPGLEPLGGGHDLLQYSCLENPMDRGAWRATVHGVTKSQIGLKRLGTDIHSHTWQAGYMRAEWYLVHKS